MSEYDMNVIEEYVYDCDTLVSDRKFSVVWDEF